MPKAKMRRVSFEFSLEMTIPEREVIRMITEMAEMLDELRSEDTKGQCLSVHAVAFDCQDPIAEYSYTKAGPDEQEMRHVRIADEPYLADLGYKIKVPQQAAGE